MLDNLTNNPVTEFDELLPWLIDQIFAHGMSHDTEDVFYTCARLMANTLIRVLQSNYTELQKDDMCTQCFKFMKRALNDLSRYGSSTNDPEVNRALFLDIFPLKQIFEISFPADNISLNYVALQTLGLLF